jgi:hypothetical protein
MVTVGIHRFGSRVPSRRLLLAPGLWVALLCSAGSLHAIPAHSQPQQKVPLECQLESAEWQPCQLTIEQLGSHWWLEMGGKRFEFHSDGRGGVTLTDSSGARRQVEPVWTAQQALCWNGVCAKGDLPLD